MNYILLHWSYGRESMRMTVDQMTADCYLIAKKSSGDWMEYGVECEWKPFPKAYSTIVSGENNIINWGNHILSADNYFKVNTPSAIALAADKARSRKYLQEAGVAVPKSFFYPDLEWTLSANFPIIVRPSHHHGGQNFNVTKNPVELQCATWGKSTGTWYASEVFEKTTEYRVHCAHGRILLVQEKPLVAGEIRANQAVNHESWRVLKWGEINKTIALESLKAIEVLGLDYGAVDIMFNEKDGSCAICEVNTSPSINTEYSSSKYAKYFSWLIRNNFPNHFSLAGGFGKNGYVFDNDMLEEIL